MAHFYVHILPIYSYNKPVFLQSAVGVILAPGPRRTIAVLWLSKPVVLGWLDQNYESNDTSGEYTYTCIGHCWPQGTYETNS